MSPEQFIFWLNGYISDRKYSKSEIIVETIRLSPQKVKLENNIRIAPSEIKN